MNSETNVPRTPDLQGSGTVREETGEMGQGRNRLGSEPGPLNGRSQAVPARGSPRVSGRGGKKGPPRCRPPIEAYSDDKLPQYTVRTLNYFPNAQGDPVSCYPCTQVGLICPVHEDASKKKLFYQFMDSLKKYKGQFVPPEVVPPCSYCHKQGHVHGNCWNRANDIMSNCPLMFTAVNQEKRRLDAERLQKKNSSSASLSDSTVESSSHESSKGKSEEEVQPPESRVSYGGSTSVRDHAALVDDQVRREQQQSLGEADGLRERERQLREESTVSGEAASSASAGSENVPDPTKSCRPVFSGEHIFLAPMSVPILTGNYWTTVFNQVHNNFHEWMNTFGTDRSPTFDPVEEQVEVTDPSAPEQWNILPFPSQRVTLEDVGDSIVELAQVTASLVVAEWAMLCSGIVQSKFFSRAGSRAHGFTKSAYPKTEIVLNLMNPTMGELRELDRNNLRQQIRNRYPRLQSAVADLTSVYCRWSRQVIARCFSEIAELLCVLSPLCPSRLLTEWWRNRNTVSVSLKGRVTIVDDEERDESISLPARDKEVVDDPLYIISPYVFITYRDGSHRYRGCGVSPETWRFLENTATWELPAYQSMHRSRKLKVSSALLVNSVGHAVLVDAPQADKKRRIVQGINGSIDVSTHLSQWFDQGYCVTRDSAVLAEMISGSSPVPLSNVMTLN